MFRKTVALLKLLRPHQWLKNLMLLFPPFLGGTLLQTGLAGQAVLPLASFCLASSATYIFNDILDAGRDALHPRKSLRPIPAGQIGKPLAAAYGLLIFGAAVVSGTLVSPTFLLLLLTYLVVSAGYSIGLKGQPIVDIFCIAAGFVLRLQAGGTAFRVKISDWLFLSVLFLALFLSCGKRLSEKHLLGNGSADHRKVLDDYPPGALQGFIFISGAAVLVTYTLYVITMHRLVYTVPLCCFGLFRYILIVKRGQSGDPTDSLLKDPVTFLVGIAWVVMVGASLYLGQ